MQWRRGVLIGCAALSLAACGGGGGGGGDAQDDGGGGGGAVAQNVVVLAWNDLGMHCLNETYDQGIILPPYNTVWAQVVVRGAPPEVVTTGVTVEYRILNNTSSADKAHYGQFWANLLAVFGVDLAEDTGLNLVDAGVNNGLSGQMVVHGDHFAADGIPLTPVEDGGAWNPYQVAEITVKGADGAVLARTRATVPTSEELNCSKCHGVNPWADILAEHDQEENTNLAASAPLLCANGQVGCHASPALGQGLQAGQTYLSQVMHSFHAALDTPPTCYDCHPGAATRCNRSLEHFGSSAGGGCQSCHGELAEVGGSIVAGRTPWAEEPTCDGAGCHSDAIAQVDTGATLYRNAKGHGGLHCPACHGSPHAMVPSREGSDNYQAQQYHAMVQPAGDDTRGRLATLGSCAACHASSRGADEVHEFAGEHGGTNPRRRTACHVCHTAVPTTTAQWPHAFGWQERL